MFDRQKYARATVGALQRPVQYHLTAINQVGRIRTSFKLLKSLLPLLAREGMSSVALDCTIRRNTQAHSLAGGAPLVLEAAGIRSNYAYKKGVADPVFKYTGGMVQYTNVLVGFTDDDCKEDIAMRPYIKLQDESGEEVTLHGGTVYRSIGYIA